MTQEDLAHASGITTTALARLERGQTNPTWATLRGVAEGLGVSMVDLVSAVEDA